MPTRSRLLLFVALACVLPVAAARAQPREPNFPWTDHLVEVSTLDRMDPPAALVAERAALQVSLDAAAEGRERSRIEREMKRLDKRIQREHGYVLVGWGAKYERSTRRTDTSIALVGFLVPGTPEVHRLVGSLRPGGFVTVDRRATTDLFTAEGRRYRTATRIAPPALPPAGARTRVPSPVPSSNPSVLAAADVTITFARAEARSSGTLVRHQIRIAVEGAPARARRARLWLRARARTPDGIVLGPISMEITVDRAPSGVIGQSRSFEIITAPGVTVDPDKTTIELVAMTYE